MFPWEENIFYSNWSQSITIIQKLENIQTENPQENYQLFFINMTVKLYHCWINTCQTNRSTAETQPNLHCFTNIMCCEIDESSCCLESNWREVQMIYSVRLFYINSFKTFALRESTEGFCNTESTIHWTSLIGNNKVFNRERLIPMMMPLNKIFIKTNYFY